jgi:RND superfamily putative drug exporter
VSKEQLAKGETFGFPIILIVLLAAFGTAVAAFAPPALGFASVIVTGALIYLLSRSMEMSIYVQNISSMLGIGVAVDYSLFVVSRFRRELAAGKSKDDAVAEALASSGHAVVISGATVAASLAGLFIINLNAIRSMAIGAILVVCISVLASVTLLPALLSVVGGGIERFRIRLPWKTSSDEAGTSAFWQRWTDRVLAHPVVAIVGSTAVMLLLASPLLAIQTLERAGEQLPPTAEVRAATEEAQRLAGPGVTGPVHLISDSGAALATITKAVGGLPGIARVGPTIRTKDGKLYAADAILANDPESNEARATLTRIENTAKPLAAAKGATFLAGGSPVFSRDTEHAIFGNLWKMILFILVLSFVVLLVLMRSVLLPLKAVLMNLLSVGATYGILVAIFQWGWLDWTGYNSPGYVDTLIPALILAINFGLSMDYEVFLLTRIRERYLEHRDNDRAVSEGVVMSARIITSCALIMVGVFGAFAIAGGVTLKQLGIGLAVAVALDATIVRLVIVPSTMKLLGDWNWWLPARLDRILPGAGAKELPPASVQPT